MRPLSTVLLGLALSMATGRSFAIPITQRRPEDGAILALNQELEKLAHNNGYEDGRSGRTSVSPGHTQLRTYGSSGPPSAGLDTSISGSGGLGIKGYELHNGEKGDPQMQAQPHIHVHPHYTLQSLNQYLAHFASGQRPGAGIIPDGSSATEKQNTIAPVVDILEIVETRSSGASGDDLD